MWAWALMAALIIAPWVHGCRTTAAATYIAVMEEEPGRELACLPLEAGGPFSLEFVNSIYLSPVKETFIYEAGEGVFLIKVESPSAGVFEYYSLMEDRPGMAEMYRKVAEMRIRTHNYEHHRLTAGNRTLRLKGLVADGEPLLIKVRSHGSCKP